MLQKHKLNRAFCLCLGIAWVTRWLVGSWEPAEKNRLDIFAAALCGMLTSNQVQHIYAFFPPLLYPHPKISLETLSTETVFQILGFALSHKEWTICGEMGFLRYFWEHAMHSCSKKQCYQSVLWRRVQRFAEKQQKRNLVIMMSLLLGRRSVKPCAMDAFEAKYLSHRMWDRANQGIKFDIEIHPGRFSSVYMSFLSPALLKSSRRILITFTHGSFDCNGLRQTQSESQWAYSPKWDFHSPSLLLCSLLSVATELCSFH